MNALVKIAGELYDKAKHHYGEAEALDHRRNQKKAQIKHHQEGIKAHKAILAKTGLPNDFHEGRVESELAEHARTLKRLDDHKVSGFTHGAIAGGALGGALHGALKPNTTLKSLGKSVAKSAVAGGLVLKGLQLHAHGKAFKRHVELEDQLSKYRSA
jgi:hypothetical protein